MKSLKKKKAKQESSQWAHLASMKRLTACNAPGVQSASVAVDWPPAELWTPFWGRTKREFTLFSWICIVLFFHDTKVITLVYWVLNNGLIDVTLIIGTAGASRWQNTTLFIYLSTVGQARHSVSNCKALQSAAVLLFPWAPHSPN